MWAPPLKRASRSPCAFLSSPPSPAAPRWTRFFRFFDRRASRFHRNATVSPLTQCRPALEDNNIGAGRSQHPVFAAKGDCTGFKKVCEGAPLFFVIAVSVSRHRFPPSLLPSIHGSPPYPPPTGPSMSLVTRLGCGFVSRVWKATVTLVFRMIRCIHSRRELGPLRPRCILFGGSSR